MKKASAPQTPDRRKAKLLGFGLAAALALGGLGAYAALPAPQLAELHAGSPQNVSPQGKLSLHFSQPMRRRSVEEALSLEPELSGEWSWEDSRTLSFLPQEDLELGQKIRLELKGGAKGWQGKSLPGPIELLFVVSGPPMVLFADPQPKGAEEALPVLQGGQAITVMFDRPMDWNDPAMAQPLRLEPPAAGSLKIIGQSAFQFTPKDPPWQTTFTLSVPAGLPAQSGGKTEEAIVWQLRTPGQGVLSIEPTGAERPAIGPETPLKVRFRMPVDLSQVRPGDNVVLFPSNDLDAEQNERQDGFFNTQVRYAQNKAGEKDPSALVFAPRFPYKAGVEHELRLKQGLDGMEEDFVFRFRPEGPGQAATNKPEAGVRWTVSLKGEAPLIQLPPSLAFPARLTLCRLSQEQFILANQASAWEGLECQGEERSLQKAPAAEPWSLGEAFAGPWENGIYFLRIQDEKGIRLAEPLFVSDTHLLLKRAGEDLLVWATDARSQEPVSRMELTLYSYDGKELAKGVTDGDGIFKRNQPLPGSLFAVGKKTLEGESRWALVHELWLSEEYGQQEGRGPAEAYLMPEKSVARAGEEIGIIGWRKGGERQEAQEAVIQLEGLQGEEFARQAVTIGAEGEILARFALPASLKEGNYRFRLAQGETLLSSSPAPLRIRGRRPELSLDWTRLPEDGEKDPAFGLKAFLEGGFPAWPQQGRFRLYLHPENDPFRPRLLGEFPLQFQGDSASFDLLSPPGPLLEAGRRYSVEAEAEAFGQTAAAFHSFRHLQDSEEELALRLDHRILSQPPVLSGKAEPKGYSDEASVRLSLIRAGSSRAAWSQEMEAGDFRVEPEGLEPGSYILRAEAAGETAELPVHLPAAEPEPLEESASLLLDRSPLESGEKAEGLLNLPLASPQRPMQALLSYERDGLMGYQLLQADSPLTSFEFSVQARMAPGFFLSALIVDSGLQPSAKQMEELAALEGRRKEAQQEPNPKALALIEAELAALKAKLEPQADPPLALRIFVPVENERGRLELSGSARSEGVGSQKLARLELKALDSAGRSASASFAAWIAPAKPFFHSPADYFGRLPSFLSRTASSRFLKLEPPGKSREDGEEGVSADLSPRMEQWLFGMGEAAGFRPPSAMPEASASFSLPLSSAEPPLAAYALAQRGNQEGGRLKLPLDDPAKLRLEPLTPSFLSAGDEVGLRAEIANLSQAPLRANVELHSGAFRLHGDSRKTVELQPGESQTLEWTGQAPPIGSQGPIKLLFRSGQIQAQRILPLVQQEEWERTAGFLEKSQASWKGRLEDPESKARRGKGWLRLAMSPVPLAPLREERAPLRGLEALLSPSSPKKPEDSERDASSLAAAILGGEFSWGQSGPPTPDLAAYALLALEESEQAGAERKEEARQKLIVALWKAARDAELSLSERLLCLWALSHAQEYDTQLALELFQERQAASTAGKAWLLGTLDRTQKAGQKSLEGFAQTLADEILASAEKEKDGLEFPANPELPALFNSPVFNHAALLVSLLEWDPQSPMIRPLLRQLAQQSQVLSAGESFWLSWALRKAAASPAEGGEILADLKVSGKTAFEGGLGGAGEAASWAEQGAVSEGKEEGLLIEAEKKEGANLHVQASLSYGVDPLLADAQEQGAVLWQGLVGLEDGRAVLPGEVKLGQSYRSQLLLVLPRDADFLEIKAPLPAGFRPLEWLRLDPLWAFDSALLKEDQALLFARHLPAGVYPIEFSVQALWPGRFAQLPAEAQTLNDGQVQARAQGRRWTIE